MEFKNLDRKIKTLDKKFTDDLKKLIIERGHQGTGKLLNSIKATVVFQNSDYLILIEGKEYLVYLEDHKLIEDFLSEKSKELQKIVLEETMKDLKELIKKIK